MDDRTQNLIDECRRQEESCLYTSTALFEWLKFLRCWKTIFVVAPIILAAVATGLPASLKSRFEWLIGACTVLAGIATAVYKALDLDVNLTGLAKYANQFKVFQDRFRQASSVSALGAFDDFKKEFNRLMGRMDALRLSSPPPPERFFNRAQAKILSGHYDFSTDLTNSTEKPDHQ